MRFSVSQEPNFRRRKKVNFVPLSFRWLPPQKVKIASDCLMIIGKRKECRGTNTHITQFLFALFPNNEINSSTECHRHTTSTDSLKSVPFSQEKNQTHETSFPSLFPPFFSRQPNRAIKIRTISSGYDMVTVWSMGGAASDVHDIF